MEPPAAHQRIPTPLVSIGLPVYNGGRQLRSCVAALLDQDYRNFEVVISDNASTDDTEAICRELAAGSTRIRYHRAPVNKGAVWNFNHVLGLAQGEYFMWAAHDDSWQPSCIRRCAELLDAHPEAVLCHSGSQPTDPDGRPVGEPYLGPTYTNDDPSPRRRWQYAISSRWLYAAIYGVMRRSMVDRTRLLQVCSGADFVFVAELSLQGTIIQVPESLSSKRVPKSMADYRSAKEMLIYMGASAKTNALFANSVPYLELLRGLRHAPIEAFLKRRLALDVSRAYFGNGVWMVDLRSTASSVLRRH